MSPDSEPAAPRPELPMRLTRLRVKNFRSIADIDIPLSPLTVLVGPNGSGKSNVVDALRFVRDVFARGLDQAVMDREGMGVIQRWSTEGEGITIGVTVKFAEVNEKIRLDEEDVDWMQPSAEVSYEFEISGTIKENIKIKRESLIIKVDESNFPEVYIRRENNSLRGRLNNDDWIVGLEKRFHKLFSSDKLVLNRILFNIGSVILEAPNLDEKELEDLSDEEQLKDHWYSLASEKAHDIDMILQGFLFYNLNLAELREPQRLLKEFPFEEEGRNLAAVLRHIFVSDFKKWEMLHFALRQAVDGFNNLEIERVGGYLATKLIYQTDTTQPRTSYLGQESDGTIRMLGILAALYQDPPQPFISIEEPEVNIHPGALAVLAGVLDEASLRSQVLVTTHSPDLLDHLPVESFLVVEKVGDTTHVGPLDASQVASVRQRLFTPGELLRMEGLQRQPDPETPAA